MSDAEMLGKLHAFFHKYFTRSLPAGRRGAQISRYNVYFKPGLYEPVIRINLVFELFLEDGLMAGYIDFPGEHHSMTGFDTIADMYETIEGCESADDYITKMRAELAIRAALEAK